MKRFFRHTNLRGEAGEHGVKKHGTAGARDDFRMLGVGWEYGGADMDGGGGENGVSGETK